MFGVEQDSVKLVVKGLGVNFANFGSYISQISYTFQV